MATPIFLTISSRLISSSFYSLKEAKARNYVAGRFVYQQVLTCFYLLFYHFLRPLLPNIK